MSLVTEEEKARESQQGLTRTLTVVFINKIFSADLLILTFFFKADEQFSFIITGLTFLPRGALFLLKFIL